MLSQTSLDDAVSLLSRGDRSSGFHHNLGMCGERTLLSVEAPAGGCRVEQVSREPRAHTNHLIHEPFKEVNQEVARSSRDRLGRAESLIEGGALAGRDPRAILQDSAGHGMPIHRKGRYAGDPGFTLATAIFEIGSVSVDWRVYTDSTTEAEHGGRVSPH